MLNFSHNENKALAAVSCLTLALGLGACITPIETPDTGPAVTSLSKSEMRIGETLLLVGDGFVSPDEGDVLIEFSGIFV
ncbi:MAG: hypothetical protein GY822_18755 [Deltaproteobacteria bacterium]|nr:hypothetical protein [Deltaproteobacteria bacterium]